MADQLCANLGIPAHLHHEGRPVTVVLAAESLYRRFNLLTEGDISACIKFGDMSVNRGSLSAPDDVRINSETGSIYPDCGVLEIPANALRGAWPVKDRGSEINYSLEARHVPLRCNYAHAEVEVLKDGTKVPKLKPPTVKLEMRRQIQSLARIVSPATRQGESLPLRKE